MNRPPFLAAAVVLAAACTAPPQPSESVAGYWPQAAGPNHNYKASGPAPPDDWSVALDRNILWKTPLPNAGQSGIAVWGDRIFLSTFVPEAGLDSKFSADILGHCIDTQTGEILWSRPLSGSVESPIAYAYSDATTPTPVTDGETVVFTNAGGEMAAFDFQGAELWRRTWTPWGKPFPFNKQHEPILSGDVVLNVEPLADPTGKEGWNYLHAVDLATGETRWVAEDGTTTYTTSLLSQTADGEPAVLTARGGWHDVPERPVGLSLVSLSPGREGKSIWRYVADTDADGQPLAEPGSLQAPTWQSLYILHWNASRAYWFRMNPVESHLVFDAADGKLLAEQSMIDDVDYRQWDPQAEAYLEHLGVNLRDVRDLSPRVAQAEDEVIRVQPAWHANIVASGYHYFLASTGHRRNKHEPKGKGGPSHSLGRVHLETGKTEYLELPVTVIREPGQPDQRVWGVEVRTSTENSQGIDVAAEDRSRRDGWQIPAFWGTPTAVNNRVYFTTMLGVTYVIEADAEVLDDSALLAVNDLGPSGQAWSLNTISYAGGRLYHRSLKELVAIGDRSAAQR